MARYELGEIIATRELALRDGTPVVVNIGKPRPFPDDPDPSYFCPYQITGLQARCDGHVGGVDAVQALELTLKLMGVLLAASEEGKRGDIRWLDGSAENYGFPPMPGLQSRPSRWRPMTRADLPAVARIAAIVHPDYPEDPAIAAERLSHDPAGCLMLDGDEVPVAYLISHRWMDGDPPTLDSHLHALPPHPNVWYIHDIALLPEVRGTGAAAAIVTELESLARAHGLHRLALTAVNNSAAFWQRHGFTDATTPALAEKLTSYGPDARYMTRDLT